MGSTIDLMCVAVARQAHVRPGMVYAIFSRLERDGDKAARLNASLLAAAFGWSLAPVERVMATLSVLGVTCDGVVTDLWHVSRAPEHGLSMKPSAIRMRRKRFRDAGDQPPLSAIGASPSVTEPSSLSKSSLQRKIKEHKAPGHASNDPLFVEFSYLATMWPVKDRMREAEQAYRRARQRVGRPKVFTAAQRYIEELGTRYCMFLRNWRNTEPWRDPYLPLASLPRAVISSASAFVPMQLDQSPHSLGEPGDRLRRELDATVLRSWFSELKIVVVDQQMVRLVAPTKFIAHWVKSHYLERICSAWNVAKAEIVVASHKQQPADLKGAA